MNMKAMLGAFLSLVVAVGATAYLAARGATQKPLPPAELPVELKDQLRENPFDLSTPGPKSKVVVDETKFEFGTMALGDEQSHDFVFKNEGDGPLRLAKGPMMCKCTMPAVPDQEIKPGESTNIKLTWKPVENSPDFSKSAVIWTNDPANPKVTLAIKGMVLQDPVVMPSQFLLGDISWDKENESEVKVGSSVSADFKIESYEVSDPEWMTVTLTPMDVSGIAASGPSAQQQPLAAYVVKLKLSPNGKVGPFSGWVKLKTNRGTGEQTVDILGSRVGPIQIHGPDYQASNSSINLKRFKSADGRKTRMFLFIAPFGEDLQITEVISNSKNLTATLKKETTAGKEKDRYVLTVEALPGVLQGTTFSFETPDTLTLKTNHPKVPEMSFKARYIVQ